MTYEAAKRLTPDRDIRGLTLENDAKIAESVKCPIHGKTCKYHWMLDSEGTYHAYAICRRCGWWKEF